MPQTLRLSTKARAAAENLEALAHDIHWDRTITDAELARFRVALREVLDLTAHVDDSLNLAMVVLKGGPDSPRFREVKRDYEDTHGALVELNVHLHNKQRRRGTNHDDAA